MSIRIDTAVFPVAGLGTRILPATKVIPKEMLPVVDRPLIEYAVDEARSAGIEKFVFVVSPGRSLAIEHFSTNQMLESVLKNKGKQEALSRVQASNLNPRSIFRAVQEQPLGLGHAVWCAQEYVGNAPFAVMLTDDLVLAKKPCLEQMVEAYAETGGCIVAIEEVKMDQVDKYGIVNPGARSGNMVEVKGLVEKPAPSTAPSNLAVIGRYILQPEVFEYLSMHSKGAGGEIQLTDAMDRLLLKTPFYGLVFEGKRYDCGSKEGYLAANVAVAQRDPDFAAFLKSNSED